MEFQVVRLDVRQPSAFLRLGEVVANTKFKVTKFEFKTRKKPNGTEEDASELTLTHTDNGEMIVLVVGAPPAR